jgi:hypothetical protein
MARVPKSRVVIEAVRTWRPVAGQGGSDPISMVVGLSKNGHLVAATALHEAKASPRRAVAFKTVGARPANREPVVDSLNVYNHFHLCLEGRYGRISSAANFAVTVPAPFSGRAAGPPPRLRRCRGTSNAIRGRGHGLRQRRARCGGAGLAARRWRSSRRNHAPRPNRGSPFQRKRDHPSFAARFAFTIKPRGRRLYWFLRIHGRNLVRLRCGGKGPNQG